MSFLRNYFGTTAPAPSAPACGPTSCGPTSATPAEEGNTPIRALPASWYTSQAMYELEQRSIFGRKWLLTTHKARVPNPGDVVKYDAAGYEFVVARDMQGIVSAFHASDLLPAHTHIDRNGFVWVNMDASETPEVAWKDDFDGVDEQPRFQYYNFDEYNFDHTWDMEGDFNWKILADNYNECYHCLVAHPDIPTIADLNSYYVKSKDGHIQHYGAARQDQIDKGFRIATTYFWPNASFNVSPNFFFMQRFTPISPTQSVMRYEVYRHKDATDEAFNLISDMYKRIMSEDKVLCAASQKNLNAGVFVNGQLHPKMESGPLHFQKTVRDVVVEHHEKEEVAGHKISPARRPVLEVPSFDQKATSSVAEVASDEFSFRTGADNYESYSMNSGFAPAISV